MTSRTFSERRLASQEVPVRGLTPAQAHCVLVTIRSLQISEGAARGNKMTEITWVLFRAIPTVEVYAAQ